MTDVHTSPDAAQGGAPATGTIAPAAPAWHTVDVDDVAAAQGVDVVLGLDAAEARRRAEVYGANRLEEPPRRPSWRLLLDQFRNFLVLVLLGTAVLAGLVGEVKDTVVITVVLLLNAVLGFVQEHRAEASLAALKAMLTPEATVRRDGATSRIPAEDVVPGDLVLLETGDRVPADGRVVAAHGLEIDESALTGESTPVAKSVASVDFARPLAERTGMAYANTVVTRGRAEVLVTATGMATEIGRLAELLHSAPQAETPLQVQLHSLGRRLAVLAAAAVSVFFVLGLVRGQPLGETALAALALAVAAIPEGLPAVVTVTLAVGISQMAKHGAIVKRLSSVETLGATTVICSDKTGTLTRNEMAARAVLTGEAEHVVTGDGYAGDGRIEGAPAEAPDGSPLRELLVAGALCNDSRVVDGALIGDPTEGALVALATKGGIDAGAARRAWPRLAEMPFDSARKVMATVHAATDGAMLLVKGAPDVVLARCTARRTADGVVTLDAEGRAAVLSDVDRLAGRGLRVLAVACRELPEVPEPDGDAVLSRVAELTLLGLVGLQDPPRPEAAAAIATACRAGVAVKMITGDHVATARAIADDLGIPGEAVTGAELEAMSDEELRDRVDVTGVFARVAPEHKVRIVHALKANGHIVAMTGDGVNDAPALKTADIGVAMGIAGTEVSKEAAAMVLTDDNVATIVRAVESGRTIYDNIGKFVRFQLSTNLGAIATLLGAQVLGMPVPFTALQVLWVNLIMDGPPAIALGLDPAARTTMDRPPRDPKERILTLRRLTRLSSLGLVMAAGTLGTLAWGLSTGDTVHAMALAFTVFVLFQIANALNSRSERDSVFSTEALRNGKLWTALAGVLVLQVLVVHVGPLQALFGTSALTWGQWALAAAVASSIIWVEEMRKLVARRLARRSVEVAR